MAIQWNGLISREIASLRRKMKVRRCLRELCGGEVPIVQHGPFPGMRYLQSSTGSQLVPKIVGSYEEPVHEWTKQVIARKYRRIIEIGCAEGYYAVGFARACPDTEILAFDVNEEALKLCEELIALNGVENIELRGLCDHALLNELCGPDTLVFADIEGAELELLDPARAPGLLQVDLVMELHDFIVPGTREAMYERFGATHEIEIVTDSERDPADYPVLERLTPDLALVAMDERRQPAMEWLRASRR